MTLEDFLQSAAIYAVLSVLVIAWFVRIKSGQQKDDDDFPDGMA